MRQSNFSKSKKSIENISKLSKDISGRDGTPSSIPKSGMFDINLNKKMTHNNIEVRRSKQSPMENVKISQKLSQNMLEPQPNFDNSDISEYFDEVRNSNERPLDGMVLRKSKNKMYQNLKNVNSKITFETNLTTKESSTSSLINKLRIRPDKNRSKKVSRSEMDNVMRIMSEILIKVNNNRMRLDTLEGNVEIKIEQLIKDFTEMSSNEIKLLQDEVKDDIEKIHKRLGEFERLNYRLNKKILDKPYKYADDIKAALQLEDKNLKEMITKKHDVLLSRIVELKLQMSENAKEDGSAKHNLTFQTFGQQNESRLSMQVDYENSKIALLQTDFDTLREQFSDEFYNVSKQMTDLNHRVDDFKDKIDFEIYEFKSGTAQQVNNSLKEFQNLERELKRYQDLYREMLGKYCKIVENKLKVDKDLAYASSRVNPKISEKVREKQVKTRIHSISPSESMLPENTIKESHRYKLSKSVLEQKSLKPRRPNFELPETDPDKYNRSVLPTIKTNKHSEINRTLQSIKDADSKQFKLLKKLIKSDHKSIKKEINATPMKLGFNSKVHVNLHSLL